MKIRHTVRTSAILLILVFAFAAMLMVSCDPVDLFAEYRGVNLINSFQFSEELVAAAVDDGWQADWGWNEATQSTVANNYMIFIRLNGTTTPTLGVAQGYGGLPAFAPDGDPVLVYRLEILNQFANGDFENIGTATANFNTVAGGPTITANAAPDFLGTGNSIELDSAYNDIYYIDLAARINTWAVDQEYVFHFDYYPRSVQTYFFQFDDGSNVPDYLNQITIGARSETALSFPGVTEDEKDNYLQASNSYDRWYFGRVDGQTAFFSQIDNVRFVRSDVGYAARLQIPYTDPDSGLTLVQGGSYVFSIYVHKDDPAEIGGNNRFFAQTINITIRDIYGGVSERTTATQDFDISGLGAGWVKITMAAENLVKAIPADPAEPMLEVAITASGLSSGNASSYALDAGSVLIALPELKLGD
jgi:hypothetical protein